MLKEISEQPDTVARTLSGRLDERFDVAAPGRPEHGRPRDPLASAG